MEDSLKARFEELALPHLDAVLGMARTLARNSTEADDLVQETFIRAFRAFKGFELREYGAKPWLLKILHNVFYSRRTKERRAPTLLDDVDFDSFMDEIGEGEVGSTPPAEIDWDRFDEEIKHAVSALPEEYREVLLLWALQDLSYKEIAEVCGCATGTVMSRLYRGRQQMGKSLRDYARERNVSSERFDL